MLRGALKGGRFPELLAHTRAHIPASVPLQCPYLFLHPPACADLEAGLSHRVAQWSSESQVVSPGLLPVRTPFGAERREESRKAGADA